MDLDFISQKQSKTLIALYRQHPGNSKGDLLAWAAEYCILHRRDFSKFVEIQRGINEVKA